MIGREVTVLAGAYLLAGLPIGAAMLAGRASPMYAVERAQLARWWSRMALVLVLAALAFDYASG